MPNVFSMVKRVPTELQVGEWVLPFDVVSDIMAVSLPSTISALMKTCHALYTEGPKHLLCGGVQLDRRRDIDSFANFMLVEDPASRFAHLRKLAFTLASPGPFVYQERLTELLVHPSLVLQTLIFHHTGDVLERSESRLREAFGGLKTIKRLVVLGIEKNSAEFIQTIPSPLESVSISVNTCFDFHPLDIAQMLRPFSNTLHTLLINSKGMLVCSLFRELGPRDFARVRTFSVVCDSSVPELIATPAFASAFPAIKHLELIPKAHPSCTEILMASLTPFTTWEDLALNGVRDGNPSFTPRDPPPRPVSGSSAPAVEECSGELFSVYMLGLNCSLTTLRLWLPIPTHDLTLLRAVLEETRPRRLCLPTTVGDLVNLFGTFHALQTQAPARIDLYIIDNGPWIPNGVLDSASNEKAMNRLYSILEALFTRPPPHGLVELSLLFKPADRPQDTPTPMLGNVGEAFKRWASTTGTLPLAVSWRSYNEDELRWPDVGWQRLDKNYYDDDEDYINVSDF